MLPCTQCSRGPQDALPTTLAASESDGGLGVKMVFGRHIVWPDGHREIEGVTTEACPRRSLRLNLTVEWALRWCSSARIVWPDGHREIEGVTTEADPASSFPYASQPDRRSRALQPKQIPPPASHMLPSQTDPTDDTNDIK